MGAFMKYKLAIFDMDGTILNTLEDLAEAGNYVCKNHGYQTHSIEDYKFFVGNGIPKLVERFLPTDVSKEMYDTCLKEYIDYYRKNSSIKTRPYDGIEKLLNDLKKAGVRLAVNTNKVESAAIDLCERYFPGIFDFISGGGKNVLPKPAPDGVYRIFEKAGIEKIEAVNCVVFIGDSDVDIMTGKNSGIDAIGVNWGFRGEDFLRSHGAEKIAFKSEDLYRMIISDF